MNNKNNTVCLLSLCFVSMFLGFFAVSNLSYGQNIISSMRAPKIKIAGKEVMTNREIKYNTLDEELPEKLKDNRSRSAIENRRQIQVWNHNPSRGVEDAPITLLEITDLSCLYCQDMSKAADSIYNDPQYKNKVRHIVMHMPIDMYNTTNSAAFYGRLAYDSHAFWEYRAKLYDASTSTDNIFIDKLISIGLEEKKLRRMTRENARRYYRELDADVKTVKNMGEMRPPILYVNGIKIGMSIPLENLVDLVDYEIKLFEKRQ